jgi:hypothetical protein
VLLLYRYKPLQLRLLLLELLPQTFPASDYNYSYYSYDDYYYYNYSYYYYYYYDYYYLYHSFQLLHLGCATTRRDTACHDDADINSPDLMALLAAARIKASTATNASTHQHTSADTSSDSVSPSMVAAHSALLQRGSEIADAYIAPVRSSSKPSLGPQSPEAASSFGAVQAALLQMQRDVLTEADSPVRPSATLSPELASPDVVELLNGRRFGNQSDRSTSPCTISPRLLINLHADQPQLSDLFDDDGGVMEGVAAVFGADVEEDLHASYNETALSKTQLSETELDELNLEDMEEDGVAGYVPGDDQDDEDNWSVDKAEAIGAASLKDTMLRAVRGENARMEQHRKQVETSHDFFKCKCKFAKDRGAESCLDIFGKKQFRQFHAETYGNADPSKDPAADKLHRSKLETVTNNLIGHVWALKVDAVNGRPGDTNQHGHVFTVRQWELNKTPVCKLAWQAARGASGRRHRTLCKHAFDLWLCLDAPSPTPPAPSLPPTPPTPHPPPPTLHPHHPPPTPPPISLDTDPPCAQIPWFAGVSGPLTTSAKKK